MVDRVAIIGIAAIDDDVAGLHQCGDLVDDPAGDGGRQHQPGAAGFVSLPTKSSSEVAPVAPSLTSSATASGLDVVDDAFVAIPHQAAHHVGAHPAQSHHANLHRPASLWSV